jgi:hypothetical protein
MGMELVRGNEICNVSATFWEECLELAIAFGWRPAGTLYAIADLCLLDDRPDVRAAEEARREREWGGWYISNDWQRVTDVDAWALAASLSRAIAAIERALKLTPDQKEALNRMETHTGLLSSKCPVDPASLKRIVDFVSKGGFEIA